MKNKVFINIPHSKLKAPKEFYEKLIVDRSIFEHYNIFMSDFLVDKFAPMGFKIFKAKFSRLFCDIERFSDDSKEEMSKLGMGVVYTKFYDGKEFIKFDKSYKKNILENYYFKYHSNLDNYVLKNYKSNNLILVDLHSYDEKMVKVFKKLNKPCPDICIGINNEFTCDKLKNVTKDFFEKIGYNVDINYPYSDTMVPNICFKEKIKINSIMLEINKKEYLEDYKSFRKLKNNLKKYFKLIKKINL